MFGLVSPDNQVVREEANIDPSVSTKPGWTWLPVTELNIPIHDSKTQLLEGPNFNILEQTIEKFWTVRSKTPEEIDAEKTTVLDSMQPIIIELLFNQENKIRQLQQAPLINKDDFLIYIKSLI